MAGWLGSNLTAQLDTLKKGVSQGVSQVSNIVKDTLVVDETWDQENGEEPLDDDSPYSRERELMRECKRLDKLHKVNL